MYGDGGEKNEAEAIYWYKKAAEKDNPNALNNLGVYERSHKNIILAADYFFRAGKAYLKRDDRDGALKTLGQLEELNASHQAKLLSALIYNDADDDNKPNQSDQPSLSSGTGWFISPKHVVTCNHVISDHSKYYLIQNGSDKKIPLKLVVADRQNDIAVLQIVPLDVEASSFIPLSTGKTSAGEEVFTVGYPHTDLLGKEPKYTEGSISSTTGIRDDPRALQVSVPIQSGNSGGPLLGEDGRAVGIITSKLAAAKVFEWTGDLPQNINYAVKSVYLRILLESEDIEFSTESKMTEDMTKPQIVEKVTDAVGLIIAE
jgi:S1-C subfamily serine protease